jgi:hypothetical protein
MEKREKGYNIIKDHIIEILKTLEKNRYSTAKITLKDQNKLKQNMFHENMILIFNRLLENLLNYLHHTINNKLDETLNEIFNEIRMNIFIHNACLIQKYMDIIKIIYENITIDELDIIDIEAYLDSFECQVKLILKIYRNDILNSLTDCDIKCKMVYDPKNNPIKIN